MKKAFPKIIQCFLTFAVSATVFAQRARVEIEQRREGESISSWWYVLIFVMVIALVAVIFELISSKKAEKKAAAKLDKKRKFERRDMNVIDADREIEWAKNKTKLTAKKSRKRVAVESAADTLPDVYEVPNIDVNLKSIEVSESKKSKAEIPLPIFHIKRVELARPFLPLPVSNDEFLLDAVEQVNEEFEEDEEARGVALNILAAFKKQNSVEAIAQVALYDLSSNLRSRAVSILADFDHESVFETLVLACADPTREVRAAAARALFRISFERSEAWLRLSEYADTGRIRQCARALIAGDLVGRSLERLTHPDRNYCAEAFSLAVLLIRAGETEDIFAFFKSHPDPNLKKAILHVIKLTDEPAALEKLLAMQENFEFDAGMRPEIEKILEDSCINTLRV